QRELPSAEHRSALDLHRRRVATLTEHPGVVGLGIVDAVARPSELSELARLQPVPGEDEGIVGHRGSTDGRAHDRLTGDMDGPPADAHVWERRRRRADTRAVLVRRISAKR